MTSVSRSARRGAAVLVALAVVSSAPVARADFDFETSVALAAAGKRELPSVSVEEVNASSRTIAGGGQVQNRGGAAFLGGRFEVGGVVDDRWRIPLLGFAAYGAVGSYATTVSSLDGSIARLRPWTAFEIDALLPGFGVRAKKRRWMFSGDVRLGVGFFGERVAVASGAESFLAQGTATTLLVDVDLTACRRLDPMQRVCLQVTPRIYDFGFANGGTIGLRFEVGP